MFFLLLVLHEKPRAFSGNVAKIGARPHVLVEKSLKNLAQDGVLAQVHEQWPLTLYDLDVRFLKAPSCGKHGYDTETHPTSQR